MVNHRARIVVILTVAICMAVASAAWAGPPTDQLREGIDRVFKILRDPQMAGDANATQRRSAIFTAASTIFDFTEMAKRTLGPHWTARTPAERTEFVALFTELMQRSYISKVDQLGQAQMSYRGETVDGDHAAVRTTIPLSNGSEMPLEYRMHNGAGRWRVYDLGMDGISLVSNYRAQFNKIIRVDSFEVLVAKLKSRQLEFAGPAASGKAAR